MGLRLSFLISFFIASVLFAACKSEISTDEAYDPTFEATVETPPPSVVIPTSLEGGTWHLDSYVDGKGNQMAVLTGSEITIEFKDRKVTGSAGCNTYFASYQVDGDLLTIGSVGFTEMYCLEPEGVMEQEKAYLSALNDVYSHRVKEGRLQITNAQGETELIYIPVEENSAFIQGK